MKRLKKISLFAAVVASQYVWGEGGLRAQTAVQEISAPALASAATSIELRGIMVSRDGPAFNIFDEASGQSRWIRLHESHRGFRFEEFRAAENAVVIKSARGTAVLVLAAGRGTDASMVAPWSNISRRPDFTSSTAGFANLPADQQEKLNELAMEVRRRQAARQASGDPTGP